MNLSHAQQVVIFDLVNLEDIDDTSLKVLMQLNQTHIVRFVVKSVALRHKMQAAANAADKPINIRTDLAHALC